MERLEPYMTPLKEEERPQACQRCKHRHMLRWLLGQKFCQHSGYTCISRTKPCDEFEGDCGEQLTLF